MTPEISILAPPLILGALGFPFVFALVGRLLSTEGSEPRAGALLGFAIGLFGPLALLLALLHAWLMGKLGLSSLLGLGGCLLSALAMGLLWGLLVRGCARNLRDRQR